MLQQEVVGRVGAISTQVTAVVVAAAGAAVAPQTHMPKEETGLVTVYLQ